MKSVLLTAGSRESAEIAFEAVSSLADATGAAVHLLGAEAPRWAASLRRDGFPAEEGGPGSGARAPVTATAVASELADAAVRHARKAAPDLVVFAPETTLEAGPTWLDATAMRLASETGGAVLVVRRGCPWPPARTLLPAGRTEIGNGTVPLAASWLRMLGGAADGHAAPDAPRLDVLHLGRDADEWHDGGVRLAEQLAPLEGSLRTRRLSCMRFGTAVRKRVLDCLRDESVDLLVLARHGETDGDAARAGSLDWLRVFAHARCSVLLLPRRGPAREEARAAVPGWHRLVGWVRDAERVPAPA